MPPELSPLAHSLNCSVQDHRRLLDILLALRDCLGDCHCAVWLPVFNADGSLAALYQVAASQPPVGGWTLHTPSADRGSAPALDAYLSGELTSDADADQQHIPIFGCDGDVRVVMSVGSLDEGCSIFASPEAVYRAIGQSGLLELAAECVAATTRHLCPSPALFEP